MAKSLRREAARATSRLATFIQAMQNTSRGGKQHVKRRLVIMYAVVEQSSTADRVVGMRMRIVDLGLNGSKTIEKSRQVDAVVQTRNHEHVMHFKCRKHDGRLFVAERSPDLYSVAAECARVDKRGGKDAYDVIWFSVEPNSLANNCGIAVVPTVPEDCRQDHSSFGFGTILGLAKSTSELRHNAKH